MITSEFGLYNLPHISTPAGINELHNSIEQVVLHDITNIPFAFIRGVKCMSERIENCDIMRGEETELMGIVSHDYGKCIYILPGSHSKIINTDENNRISSFFIGIILCGEIQKIIKSNAETVVIGGKSQLKNAIVILLENRDNKKLISLDEKTVEYSTALGAIKIFEKRM